jgi:hypothetical protein
MSLFSTVHKLLDIQCKILWEYISHDNKVSHPNITNVSEERNEMGFHMSIITVLGMCLAYENKTETHSVFIQQQSQNILSPSLLMISTINALFSPSYNGILSYFILKCQETRA